MIQSDAQQQFSAPPFFTHMAQFKVMNDVNAKNKHPINNKTFCT